MNNADREAKYSVIEKYKAVISVISKTEDRLRLSELVYLSLSVIVLLFTIAYVTYLIRRVDYILTYFDYALVFLCISIGMSVNIYWVAFAMRLQLKLKLRYFQARSIERDLGCPGQNIFSDEHIFFDPDIRRLVSSDEKEVLTYPSEGLSRMDGVVGALKPRHFSWLLPVFFVSIYWAIFFLVITKI